LFSMRTHASWQTLTTEHETHRAHDYGMAANSKGISLFTNTDDRPVRMEFKILPICESPEVTPPPPKTLEVGNWQPWCSVPTRIPCMYAYLCICMYVCMYACIYICSMYLCMYNTCVCIRAYVWYGISVKMCAYACMYLYV
jgi:hypothetical protein